MFIMTIARLQMRWKRASSVLTYPLQPFIIGLNKREEQETMNSTNNVKSANKETILRMVYKYHSVTKSSLASSASLTVATVNNLMSELCTDGICEETGFASGKGRRSVLYSINRKYGFIVGLRLTRASLILSTHDLSLAAIDVKVIPNDISDVVSSLRKIEEVITERLSALKEHRILGIGVTVPGRTSADGTIIQIPDYSQWNSIQLRKIISGFTDVPIVVDNDTNALVLASELTGLSSGVRSFVYLNFDDGVGAGFMNKGHVFYGSNSQSCEVGHITIDPNGPVCKCGRKGCFQAYVSDAEILRRVNGNRARAENMDQAIRLYREGDPFARESFSAMVSYINMAIRNVIMMFDPELIILRNRWLTALPDLFGAVSGAVLRSKTDENNLPIRGKLDILLDGDHKTVEASPACIMMERLFSSVG